MPSDYSRIWPYAIALLTIFIVYRRLRRSFGRQPLRPARMGIRIAILAVLAGSLLPTLRSNPFLPSACAALLAGAALGVWGARNTRFQTSDGQLYYLPHTYTGIAVSLLFLGRLVYRLAMLYSLNRAGGAAHAIDQTASPTMLQSPLTAASLYLVVGYYVCYYGLVLWKSKHIKPEDLEAGSASGLAEP